MGSERVYQGYAGTVTFSRVQIRESNVSDRLAACRKVLRGRINVEEVPGGHGGVAVHEPNVGVVAESGSREGRGAGRP